MVVDVHVQVCRGLHNSYILEVILISQQLSLDNHFIITAFERNTTHTTHTEQLSFCPTLCMHEHGSFE